jgi:hypothetical protein
MDVDSSSMRFCDLCERGPACNSGESCVLVGNPDRGFTGFNNMFASLLTVFNTMTLEGWSGTLFALGESSQRVVVTTYFITLLMCGGLL